MKPVVGKTRLDADVYFLTEDGKERLEDVGVYVHVKGYERARVTHLDVESKPVKKVVHRGRGNFLDIRGIAGGIVITPKVEREVKLDDRVILIEGLEILCPFLDGVLEPGETTRTSVGRKFDGIYIGFRREQILKLEKRAAIEFGVQPLKRLEKRGDIGF